jgi:hypothetical protein
MGQSLVGIARAAGVAIHTARAALADLQISRISDTGGVPLYPDEAVEAVRERVMHWWDWRARHGYTPASTVPGEECRTCRHVRQAQHRTAQCGHPGESRCGTGGRQVARAGRCNRWEAGG